jgi:periplasmic protein TonB
MSSSISFKKIVTANDLFKEEYNRTMRWALLGAFIFTIIFFLVTPQYHPNPYKLRTKDLEVQEIQEAVDEPPPPQEIPKPPQQVEAAPDDEVDDDTEIADTLMDTDEMLEMDMEGLGGGDMFVASQDKPRILKYAQPDYPEMARVSQLQGTVIVKVQVGTDGSVIQAIVIQAVHPILDRAAVDAAKRCKFKPGKQRGIPVKAWMAIPYAFSLTR